MTPRLSKTLKVSVETHHAIKLAAAQEGVSMADWLDNVVSNGRSYVHPFLAKLNKWPPDDEPITYAEEKQAIHQIDDVPPQTENAHAFLRNLQEQTSSALLRNGIVYEPLQVLLLNNRNGFTTAVVQPAPQENPQ